MCYLQLFTPNLPCHACEDSIELEPCALAFNLVLALNPHGFALHSKRLCKAYFFYVMPFLKKIGDSRDQACPGRRCFSTAQTEPRTATGLHSKVVV